MVPLRDLKSCCNFADLTREDNLGEVLPMILGQMKNADNQFTRSIPQLHTKPFTPAQKETISYIGGGILCKLFYNTKENEGRSFIKTLGEGDVPSTYEIHNRGGLWGCSQNVQQLLLEAQSEFDCTIQESKIQEKLLLKTLLAI